MVHPEDYERVAAAIMEKKQAGQQESVEYRIRRIRRVTSEAIIA